MPMMGRVAQESDIAIATLALLPRGNAFPMAVLVNSRHGAMLVPAMERRKNDTHDQECEQANDKAVPFHRPEQRA